MDQGTETFTKVISTDLSLADTYEIRYQVRSDSYPDVLSSWSSPFVYRVVDPCAIVTVTKPTMQAIDYQIGDPAIEVPFEGFGSLEASACNYSWDYALSSVTDPIGGADISAYVTL